MYEENGIKYIDESKVFLVECVDKTIESFTFDKNTQMVNKNAFKDCKLLKKVDFNNSIKKLLFPADDFIFPENSIEEITITKRILDNVFFERAVNMENIRIVNISASCGDEIPWGDFFELDDLKLAYENKLEYFNVEDNTNDATHVRNYSIDGVWCVNDEIVLYPQGRKDSIYEIPKSILVGQSNTFFGNKYIEKIIFPENFDFTKSYSVIYSCPNLKSIVIKGKDKKIDMPFFGDCPELEYIACDESIKVEFPLSDKIKVMSIKEEAVKTASSFAQLNKIYKDLEK